MPFGIAATLVAAAGGGVAMESFAQAIPPAAARTSATAALAPGSPDALQADFAAAAREFRVPRSVLMAVSYRETRWESHNGLPSTTGNYNVMGLTHLTGADIEPLPPGDRSAEIDLSGDPARMRRSRRPAASLSGLRAVRPDDPRLHTLDAAARLIGVPAEELRHSARQSIRGGAALLARYEREAVGSLPADPGRWPAAVARYSQAPDARGATLFTRRVFAAIRDGVRRVTGDGQRVALAPDPSVSAGPPEPPEPTKPPEPSGPTEPSEPSGSREHAPTPECPAALHCDFIPAAYAQNSGGISDFGNYNQADRPADGNDIRYIVIHDTEGGYDGSVAFFRKPDAYASAHYVIRASDGLVTQMVRTKDEAWHAGNKTVNMHSIGIEHEGYAVKAGSWYTEPQYESSAALVRYLTARFHVPLDRQHIIGHDDVPGPLDKFVSGMHWDPGPFWDWNHYMSLLGAPTGAGGPLVAGEAVTIAAPFSTANMPTVTDCAKPGCAPLDAHPANFVYLRTSPAADAPLLSDPYLRSKETKDGDAKDGDPKGGDPKDGDPKGGDPKGGDAGSTAVTDWGDKAVTGQSFVVAGQQGDWTAIWFGGRKAWFANPGGQWTVPLTGSARTVLTPRDGVASIPVYGRAYPEAAAFDGTGVPAPEQTETPLTKYTIPAGQAYVPAGPAAPGDLYHTQNVDGSGPGDRKHVAGKILYYAIRYNHRLAYVRASDVRTLSIAKPPSAAKRWNPLPAGGGRRMYDALVRPGAPNSRASVLRNGQPDRGPLR